MTAGCGESCWNLALTSHGLVNCSSSQEYPWAKSEKELLNESGHLQGTWTVPQLQGETLRGACVEDRHSVLLAMQDESPLPRLLRVKVPINSAAFQAPRAVPMALHREVPGGGKIALPAPVLS
eukprot:g15770.t1